ncbi:AraC family transcriptional regulator [Dokdonella sp.]|uniref:AraC family transcriptional regulator n=1 Tax=Dokdonella sp. TaxID=2291710 RepID=UPI00260916B3|nr:AraC family transcriptional regulator [Dokdonella sp.]
MLSLRSYRRDAASHRHGFHQLVLPRLGALDMEIDGCGGRVERDRTAIVGAGERHAFEARGDNRFVVVDLPPGDGDAEIGALRQRRFLALGPATRLLLDGLGDHMPQNAAATAAWSRLLLETLDGGMPRNGLEAAHRLLETEPERRYDSAWLARLAGLSRAQFYRRFTAVHGIAPAAFQRRQRLLRALAQLRGSDASIARIAGELGYSEHSALTRALRKAHGSTPRAVRVR